MREIKFRALTDTGRKWKYGLYSNYRRMPQDNGYVYINTFDGHEWICDGNTLGQFTGLHDKAGKEVYESDIVRLVYDGKEYVYQVVYDESELDFKATNGKTDYGRNFQYLTCCEEVEVIGNIYEHEDLLKS